MWDAELIEPKDLELGKDDGGFGWKSWGGRVGEVGSLFCGSRAGPGPCKSWHWHWSAAMQSCEAIRPGVRRQVEQLINSPQLNVCFGPSLYYLRSCLVRKLFFFYMYEAGDDGPEDEEDKGFNQTLCRSYGLDLFPLQLKLKVGRQRSLVWGGGKGIGGIE